MLPALHDKSAMTPFVSGPINRLGSLFEPCFFGDDGGFTGRAWSWAPMAMWEDDDQIHVEAELPGVSEQDLDLTIQNGTLFIRGERKPDESRRYLYNGRSYGRFERLITLPEAVNTDDIKATLTNGVLHIDLPKSPDAKPKKITLRT